VITKNKVESPVPLLIADNVEKALIEALKLFLPKIDKPVAGIHKSAVVEADAVIDPTASIGPLAVISKGAKIGAGTVIAAGCKIGQGVIIGKRLQT
jgi:UDP-3-O-[3-hydroxymyristoyl] glucosamine N-acyltransferase